MVAGRRLLQQAQAVVAGILHLVAPAAPRQAAELFDISDNAAGRHPEHLPFDRKASPVESGRAKRGSAAGWREPSPGRSPARTTRPWLRGSEAAPPWPGRREGPWPCGGGAARACRRAGAEGDPGTRGQSGKPWARPPNYRQRAPRVARPRQGRQRSCNALSIGCQDTARDFTRDGEEGQTNEEGDLHGRGDPGRGSRPARPRVRLHGSGRSGRPGGDRHAGIVDRAAMFNRGEVQGLVDAWDDNGVAMPPGSIPYHGQGSAGKEHEGTFRQVQFRKPGPQRPGSARGQPWTGPSPGATTPTNGPPKKGGR